MPSPSRDRPLRLFVALYPPVEHARAMLERLAPLRLERCRPAPAEQLHITAHFIGDVQRNELDATVESAQRSASGLAPFLLTPQRLISLPERGLPRLLALETDAPAPLLELHRRLVQRLARARARGRFLPHFTLCRFAHDARPPRVDQAIAPPLPPSSISEVRLMCSVLRSEGARHEELARWPLGE